ncbi:MAG: hypothetical protein R2755_04175 [Acidimicrobiales bacterium]
MLTADNIPATEALARGIVHRIVGDDAAGVDAAAAGLAARWASMEPAALRAAKRAPSGRGDLPLSEDWPPSAGCRRQALTPGAGAEEGRGLPAEEER